MRTIGGADRDDALHQIWQAFCKRQRDHAAIGRADNGVQLSSRDNRPLDAEPLLDRTQLIEGKSVWPAADPSFARCPQGNRIPERESDLCLAPRLARRPRSTSPLGLCRSQSSSRYTAEGGHDGARIADESPGDLHVFESPPKWSASVPGSVQNALAHEAIGGNRRYRSAGSRARAIQNRSSNDISASHRPMAEQVSRIAETPRRTRSGRSP